jgi:hypothetical protein
MVADYQGGEYQRGMNPRDAYVGLMQCAGERGIEVAPADPPILTGTVPAPGQR